MIIKSGDPDEPGAYVKENYTGPPIFEKNGMENP
jgi:hypothetical protein